MDESSSAPATSLLSRAAVKSNWDCELTNNLGPYTIAIVGHSPRNGFRRGLCLVRT